MKTDAGLKAGDLLPRPIGVALPSLRREERANGRSRAGEVFVSGDGWRHDEHGPVAAMLCLHPSISLGDEREGASESSVNEVVLRLHRWDTARGSALAPPDVGTRLLHVVTDGREAICREMARLLADRRSPELANAAAYHLDGIGNPVSAFPPGMVRKLAGRWARAHELARAACERMGERALIVRAEALAGDERALGNMLEFLGVQRDEAVVRTMMADRRAASPGGGWEGGAGISGGAPGGWRRLFTQDDKARFKQAAGTLLIELGFERDLHW